MGRTLCLHISDTQIFEMEEAIYIYNMQTTNITNLVTLNKNILSV